MVVPLEHDWLSGLDVVLALSIDILEEVQASRQHKVSHAIVLDRALAQVPEVVLRQGALLRDSVGRLASVGDNDILLRTDGLSNPLLFIDQEAFLLNCLRVEASRRRLLQLLPTAIKDGNNIAAVRLRHASQHLLEGVHALAIQHAVRAIVHHTVPSIIYEKKRVAALLIVLIDTRTGLINGNLELLVIRIFQNFDLTFAVLEL